MAQVQSVFGAYATKLQVLVDNSKDKFAPLWYPKYFDFAAPQTSLSYTSVLGSSRIEAAASIISRSSSAPLRSRAALEKVYGEIPAIQAQYTMREEDYRNFLAIQSMNVDDQTKKNQLLELLFGDVKKAGDGSHKRLDYVALEGLSTGEVTITVDNNPDGYVSSTALSLGMPSGNKVNASVSWATSASAKPFDDIALIVETAKGEGKSFEKILMRRAKFLQMAACTSVVNSLVSYNMLQKGAPVATLDKVNDFLTANLLPVIEIVDEHIGIEKDGSISSVQPFSATNAVFVPAGKLGRIHNAIPIEKMSPVAHVAYADYNRALISKWKENNPFAEHTKVELNAFPGFEAINHVYLLSTTAAF